MSNQTRRSFLANSGNLALQLFIDIFCPFEGSSYSVGVIALAILNLPRAARYLHRNIIKIAVLPNLHTIHAVNP